MLAPPSIIVRTGNPAVAVEDDPHAATVHLSDGDTRTADMVVSCLGTYTGTLHPEIPLVEPQAGNAAVGFLARTTPIAARISGVITTDTLNPRPAGGGALIVQTLDQHERTDPASPVPADVVATMRERIAHRIGYRRRRQARHPGEQ